MIKLNDENRADYIASCLIEVAEMLKEDEARNKQINDLKDQIDHFKKSDGDIKTVRERLEKLESDKRYQEYFDKNEDKILSDFGLNEPEPKISKDGKKFCYMYDSDTIDSDRGEISINKKDTYVHAVSGADARRLLMRRFKNLGDISINAQHIKKVYKK